jgi:hypothetical protein
MRSVLIICVLLYLGLFAFPVLPEDSDQTEIAGNVQPDSKVISPSHLDIIDVKFCELLLRPLEFANKHIRVKGTFADGGYNLLEDRKCSLPANTNLTIRLKMPFIGVPQPDDDIVAFVRGWSAARFVRAARNGEFKGNGPQVVWQLPSPLMALDEEHWKAIKAILGEDKQNATVVVTGRFDFAGDGLLVKSKDGHFVFVGGFGNYGSWNWRIVVERIDFDPVRQ